MGLFSAMEGTEGGKIVQTCKCLIRIEDAGEESMANVCFGTPVITF